MGTLSSAIKTFLCVFLTLQVVGGGRIKVKETVSRDLSTWIFFLAKDYNRGPDIKAKKIRTLYRINGSTIITGVKHDRCTKISWHCLFNFTRDDKTTCLCVHT